MGLEPVGFLDLECWGQRGGPIFGVDVENPVLRGGEGSLAEGGFYLREICMRGWGVEGWIEEFSRNRDES